MKDIQIGNLYQLGNHRLICGDATNPSHIKKLLKNDTIDLILTDPPYGIAYVETKIHESKKSHRPIINDNITDETQYEKFSEAWLQSVSKHLSKQNSVYIFHIDKMIFPLRKAMDSSGISFRQLLVWVKTGSILSRLDYHPQHELIAYGWKGSHAFHKMADKSVLVCPKTRKNILHPTTKPLPLLRRLILNSTKSKAIVYDSFGGSGSCLLSCEQTGRHCRMIELDPAYCDVIIKRWERYTGNKAQRIG